MLLARAVAFVIYGKDVLRMRAEMSLQHFTNKKTICPRRVSFDPGRGKSRPATNKGPDSVGARSPMILW